MVSSTFTTLILSHQAHLPSLTWIECGTGTNNSCNSSNVAGASGIEVREGVGGHLDGGRLGTDTRTHARIQTHHARKDSGELDVLDVEDGAYY